jgi:Cdc6-like AAA superfamily ATPase
MTIKNIIEQVENEKKIKNVYINCMELKTSIFEEIIKKLNLKLEKYGYEEIIKYYINSKVKIIIVLDEIENLLRKKTDFSNLLKLTSMYNFILIGIANMSNIMKNVLTELNNDYNFNTTHIQFFTYSAEQIFNILKKRIDDSGFQDIFEPKLIEFISKKVIESSDIRVALDISKKAIINSIKNNYKKITIGDINNIFKEFVHSPHTKTILQLPIQNQILLCFCSKFYDTEKNFNLDEVMILFNYRF